MPNETTATAETKPNISPPLQIPGPCPQVSIRDPGFAKLTTAEKLNDSKYRELVYQLYPNEPTCACGSAVHPSRELSPGNELDKANSPYNFLVCRSGCKSACCWSMRQSVVASSRRHNANKDDKVVAFMPTYCVGNQRDNVRNVCNEEERRTGRKAAYNGNYCCRENRLRGGGDRREERGEKGMYLQSEEVSGTTVRWFDDAWNGRNDCVVERRLEGGGGCGGSGGGGIYSEYAERYPAQRSGAQGSFCCNEENLGLRRNETYSRTQVQDSYFDVDSFPTKNSCAANSYKPIPEGCFCPGKESILAAERRGKKDKTCSKKPCPGIDCLVKAFHETQEFVESIGKVPGLVGLGLMDPSESPYFGRSRTKEANLECPKDDRSFGTTNLPNPHCAGPCNAPMLGPSGRTGIIREGIPALPKDKCREGDSTMLAPDVEASRCGEPLCKSKYRKKKEVPEDPAEVEPDPTATKKSVVLSDANPRKSSKTSNKFKGTSKMHSGRKSLENSGDGKNGKRRSSDRRRSSAVRRVMSFVYSAGDTYSGMTSGHKNCIGERHRVPGNMGWLWNLNETVGRLKPRPGWRPGAITRQLNEILREAKANSSRRLKTASRSSSRSRSTPSRGKRSKSPIDRGSVKRLPTIKKDEDKEEIEPPPTLHVRRKDGTYYITMYPIRQENMEVPMLEIPTNPIQFKITKNRDDASIASSSTASDMELEFSPPAAVNRFRKKPNVVHTDAQVKQQDIIDAFKPPQLDKKDKKKAKKAK